MILDVLQTWQTRAICATCGSDCVVRLAHTWGDGSTSSRIVCACCHFAELNEKAAAMLATVERLQLKLREGNLSDGSA